MKQALNILEAPKLILEKEFERRVKRNPRYSLRAFSRALGMSHTAMSFVFSGKRPLSRKGCQKILEQLTLTERERRLLEIRIQNTTDMLESVESSTQMSLDTFALISEWYHYAILSLVQVPGFQYQARWIGKRLGISEMEAKIATDRLIRLGLLGQVNGVWQQTVPPLRISNNVPSSASQKFQKQLLQKAIESLENDPIEARDFSSITFTARADQIAYAKEKIRKFRRDLSNELEADGPSEEVYNLTVQIFPVTKK